MEIRLECQKMNEESDQLKNCEPEVMTYWIPQRFSQKKKKKKIMSCEYHTEDQ